MGKPLLKNAWDYFRDPNNWIIKWHDEKTGLVISKLDHLPIMRISMLDHTCNNWVHYDISPLVYFPNARTIEEMHQVPPCGQMSQGQIQDLIRHKWEDEE